MRLLKKLKQTVFLIRPVYGFTGRIQTEKNTASKLRLPGYGSPEAAGEFSGVSRLCGRFRGSAEIPGPV